MNGNVNKAVEACKTINEYGKEMVNYAGKIQTMAESSRKMVNALKKMVAIYNQSY